MKLIVPAAAFLLMVSVGMSLRPRDVVAQLLRMEWRHWAGLVLATFIVPAAQALLLGRILPLQPAEMAGCFSWGPGRGSVDDAERGFHMQLAAGYQVWGGLLTPIVVPLVVLVAGLLHGLTIWIPPRVVLLEIAETQFVPLLLGLALARFLPGFSTNSGGVV
jgi:predicted Na+-dependent transporter